MSTLIVYENLSSGGIVNMIKHRIDSGFYREAVLYFFNERGGAHIFERSNCIDIFVGRLGHDRNIYELIQHYKVSKVVLFSHYHLARRLGRLDIEVIIEYHRSDDLSLTSIMRSVPRDVRIIVPSEWSKKFVSDVWAGEVCVVPNEFSKETFYCSDELEIEGLSQNTKSYIYVGQMGYHKGMEFCFRAFSYLRQSGMDFQLIIVVSQSPSESDILEVARSISRYKLVDCAFPIWSISQKELASLFRLCQRTGGANVVASLRESFGLVVAESRACGLRSIVPRVAALPELVVKDDKLYTYGDCIELSNALAEA